MAQNRPPKSDHRESGLMQRMRNSVRVRGVPEPHVLLACSGGKDSVALAWILAELRRLNLLTFSIAHIHHGQHDRAESAAEAVLEIGVRLDAPVSIHRLKADDIESHKGVGLEEAMRRERYLTLAGIANESDAECIALAHHQIDQAETILLHLMRGTGLDGLVGMREWERRTIPWWVETGPHVDIDIWRPLITEAAADVAGIASESCLPIVEDPTNIDTAWRRNAIRHQLLPVLESIAEGSTAAIARSANLVSEDFDLLESVTANALTRCQVKKQLSRAELVQLHPALQARIARRWLLDQLPTLDLSADRVNAVVNLARRNRGGALVEIGSGHHVTLKNGLLSLD